MKAGAGHGRQANDHDKFHTYRRLPSWLRVYEGEGKHRTLPG